MLSGVTRDGVLPLSWRILPLAATLRKGMRFRPVALPRIVFHGPTARYRICHLDGKRWRQLRGNTGKDAAAALKARSEHPLAVAIVAAVDEVTLATDVQAATGAGLAGRRDGNTIRLGPTRVARCGRVGG